MTVARLREELPEKEFLGWQMYFSLKAQQAELEQKKAAWRRR
jgi:hypothetical protein